MGTASNIPLPSSRVSLPPPQLPKLCSPASCFLTHTTSYIPSSPTFYVRLHEGFFPLPSTRSSDSSPDFKVRALPMLGANDVGRSLCNLSRKSKNWTRWFLLTRLAQGDSSDPFLTFEALLFGFPLLLLSGGKHFIQDNLETMAL